MDTGDGFRGFDECTYQTSCLVIILGDNRTLEDVSGMLREKYEVEEISFVTFLNRVVCTFKTTQSAIQCKDDIDTKTLLNLHAFYIDVNINELKLFKLTLFGDEGLLEVPGLERNFLISPPGSPRDEWEQTAEGEPSMGGHQRMDHMNEESNMEEDDVDTKTVVLRFVNENVELPSIVVEDFDYDESRTTRFIPVTSIPSH